MNREEFLSQLRALLTDISKEEQEEAIAFYESYFEDAGSEREADIIRELGTPQKVAESIKKDIRMGDVDRKSGEYTEYGYEERNETKNHLIKTQPKSTDSTFEERQQKQPQYKTDKTTNVALVVILALLFFPVILPMMCAGFGVAVGLFFGFGLAGIICTIVGVVVIVSGVTGLIGVPFFGFLSIGSGLVVLGVGVLLIIVAYYCCKLFPLLFRFFRAIFSAPVQERRVEV